MALGHRHHPRRGDLDALARQGAPYQGSTQDSVGTEVQRPLVALEVGRADDERLVVDVELHQLRVGGVDQGLARAGEPVRSLRVPDRPGLVEAVDVRPVLVGVATLLGVAPQPDVAVGHGEQRLGDPEVRRVRSRTPRAATGRRGSGCGPAGPPRSARCSRQLAEVRDDEVRPGIREGLRACTAIDPDDEAELAGRPGANARHGILDDDGAGGCGTARRGRVPEGVGNWREQAELDVATRPSASRRRRGQASGLERTARAFMTTRRPRAASRGHAGGPAARPSRGTGRRRRAPARR